MLSFLLPIRAMPRPAVIFDFFLFRFLSNIFHHGIPRVVLIYGNTMKLCLTVLESSFSAAICSFEVQASNQQPNLRPNTNIFNLQSCTTGSRNLFIPVHAESLDGDTDPSFRHQVPAKSAYKSCTEHELAFIYGSCCSVCWIFRCL